MIRAIIVDDIDNIRQKNKELITKYCSAITIVAEANSVATAVKSIKEHLPDLVFLDVDLGDGLGFDVLQQLTPINFKVIFVTAYQEYAIKAFRFSAVDFLLKPLDPSELIEAVEKVGSTLQKESLDIKISTLLSNIERTNTLKKIVLKSSDKISAVNIQDIIRCEAFNNYTVFYLNGDEKLLVSSTLKEYDALLVPLGFFRLHQSHLINLAYFDHYLKAEGFVVMKNKSKIPLASRKKDELMSLIEKL